MVSLAMGQQQTDWHPHRCRGYKVKGYFFLVRSRIVSYRQTAAEVEILRLSAFPRMDFDLLISGYKTVPVWETLA
jgi:hypothetical protein